jgi:hypothetical protein
MKEFDGYRGSNRISSVLTLCLPGRYAIKDELAALGSVEEAFLGRPKNAIGVRTAFRANKSIENP